MKPVDVSATVRRTTFYLVALAALSGCGSSSRTDDTGDAGDAAGTTTTAVTITATVTTTATAEPTTRATFQFPPSSPGRDGPVVHHLNPSVAGGYMALIEGPVSVNGKGCLRVGMRGVVWPAATRWDDATNEVVLGTGQRVALGDRVKGGGGYFDSKVVKELEMSSMEFQVGPEVAAHVEHCYGTGEIAVVNNYSEAISPSEAEPPDAHPGAVPNNASG